MESNLIAIAAALQAASSPSRIVSLQKLVDFRGFEPHPNQLPLLTRRFYRPLGRKKSKKITL